MGFQKLHLWQSAIRHPIVVDIPWFSPFLLSIIIYDGFAFCKASCEFGVNLLDIVQEDSAIIEPINRS
jgi:hypothetical protein